MRTIQTTVYKFNELTEEGKQLAVKKLYDINVDYNWWQFVYDDANTVGLKISGFDIDRGEYVELELIDSARATAELILKNHGEECQTYKDAKQFLTEWSALVEKYSDGVNKDKVTEENEYDFDSEADELEREYKKDIEHEYLKLLRNEYEYRTSDQAIIETIEANDYEFTEDGELI